MKKALFAGLWLLPVLAWPALAASTDTMKTSGTGSRAPAVHRIPVYSEGLFGDGYERITSETDPPMPMSMRGTCSECHVYRHDYDTISKGWHFNATDPNVPAGRPGHPWIYVDAATGTQIPLSYRDWPGTFRPDQVGMSAFRFTQLFGRQMPGGGPGEIDTDVDDEIARQMIAGSLEINCLACHDRDPAIDMAEWADNIAKHNFRWAATASSAVGAVTGSARRMPDTFDPGMPDMVTDPDLLSQVPTVTYYQGAFDHRDQVFFDVGGRVPADRCYACHSGTNVDLHGTHRWKADEDIHMTSGMTCTDCHRHGIEHDMIRGYEGESNTNPLTAATTCTGCHLGEDTTPPTAGRLGAPVPTHPGIPGIHFERLTCTACHAGPWPGDQTYRAKTSIAHALGTHDAKYQPDALPHIQYPVFAKESEEAIDPDRPPVRGPRIAPHKMIWPAYWATRTEQGRVEPVELQVVSQVVGAALKGIAVPRTGDWAPLTEEQVGQALQALADAGQADPVYITGGMLYRLTEDGELAGPEQNHPAAAPYLWPIAHNVRPAAQALGVDGQCSVCHSTQAPFFFGSVGVDSPIAAVAGLFRSQYEFQGTPHGRTWAFAMSFIFRPWFKIVSIGSSAVIGVVLLLYGLKALGAVAAVLAEQE